MSAPIVGISGFADRSVRPPNIETFGLARTYIRAVAASGGAPLILPPYLERRQLRAIFDSLAGLILSGGGDIHPSFFGEEDQGMLWRVDRQRDEGELRLAAWALDEGLPVLAICRGIQVLNVARGGTLVQDIPTDVPGSLPHSTLAGRPTATIAHTVRVEKGTRLAGLVGHGDVEVNSAHHQAAATVGSRLIVTARAPDGVIEALEAVDHPFCLGVQWHPEAMIESAAPMQRLFRQLVEAARN